MEELKVELTEEQRNDVLAAFRRATEAGQAFEHAHTEVGLLIEAIADENKVDRTLMGFDTRTLSFRALPSEPIEEVVPSIVLTDN